MSFNVNIMAEIKKGNGNTNERLDKLEKKMDSNRKLIKDYIKSNDEAINIVSNKVDKLENNHEAMDDTVKCLGRRLTEVMDKLNQIQKHKDDRKS